jgi:hypothetical protein
MNFHAFDITPWEMPGVLLMFSCYLLNCDITFKITNRLKVNNDNFKLNDDFKSHITVERTLERH